ncbi:fido domain-containing protein [Xylaria intraflava]|nr:fido domain-containing protein [Xylaria intraflava]
MVFDSAILDIGGTPILTHNEMAGELRALIHRGWPPVRMRRMRPSGLPLVVAVNELPWYTLRMKCNYAVNAKVVDASKEFEQTSSWLVDIWGQRNDGHKAVIVEKELIEGLSRAVFGNIAMEHDGPGLGPDVTLKLCRRIFRGEDVGDINEGTPEYKKKLDEFMGCPGKEDTDYKAIILGRREIIQHALAMQYMIDAVVTQNEKFSENLLKIVHIILLDRKSVVTAGGKVPLASESGTYRTVPVEAGNTEEFVPPIRVSQAMGLFFVDMNDDLEKAVEGEVFDPFSFAAMNTMMLTLFHPFLQANGTICRMILNVILCKYAGVVVPIGEDEADRKKYMEIQERCLAVTDKADHGELAMYILEKARTRARAMKKKLTGKEK